MDSHRSFIAAASPVLGLLWLGAIARSGLPYTPRIRFAFGYFGR